MSSQTVGLSPGMASRILRALILRQPRDQGLTLIESLVAIIVIAITVVSVTPTIFLAVATRVQTRRTEQAVQLAQAEIDRVRVMVERGRYAMTDLPPDAGTNISAAAAPTTAMAGTVRSFVPACNNDTGTPATAVTQYLRIDTDPVRNPTTGVWDCTPDFIVQTFRSTGFDSNGATPTTASPPVGFVMGVRVYSVVAEQTLAGGGSLLTGQAALRNTTGLGNQRVRPLAVLYSVVVRNDLNQSLDNYRRLCNAAGRC